MTLCTLFQNAKTMMLYSSIKCLCLARWANHKCISVLPISEMHIVFSHMVDYTGKNYLTCKTSSLKKIIVWQHPGSVLKKGSRLRLFFWSLLQCSCFSSTLLFRLNGKQQMFALSAGWIYLLSVHYLTLVNKVDENQKACEEMHLSLY